MTPRSSRRPWQVLLAAGLAAVLFAAWWIVAPAGSEPGEPVVAELGVPAATGDEVPSETDPWVGSVIRESADGASDPDAPTRTEAASAQRGDDAASSEREDTEFVARSAEPPEVSDSPRPTAVRVPALDVDVPVDAVGVTDDGQMQIPDSGYRVGWYRFGPAPGDATGTAVLASHVNTRAEGAGALSVLGELEAGEDIVVSTEDGDVRYAVQTRTSVPKAQLDTEALFDRDGDPRLVLVTCGGPWLEEAGAYRDNVVVEAVPVGDGR